jgi:hypothetical protein
MSENEEIKEEVSTGETVEGAVVPCAPAEPTVSGNPHIEIISHSLLIKEGDGIQGSGVVLNLKNNAGKDIGKAVFSVALYDADGNMFDTVEESLKDFDKDGIRSFNIEYPDSGVDIRSYAVSVVKTVLTPDSEAVGNDKIAVLSHRILEPDACAAGKRSLELEIKNICEKTLATAVLEAKLLDGEGNLLDSVCHKELEFKPQSICTFNIIPEKAEAEAFRTYKVSVRKALTTDFEKVQIKSHDMKPLDDAVEVSGVLKNISDGKADAAVVTLFKDVKDEKIATRVVYVRDIEPGASKQFKFRFVVPAGETVNSYVISVGTIAEEAAKPVV